jgi:hypothetical protein
MNKLKIIIFNLLPLILVLSSFWLLYTDKQHWFFFLVLGVISHLIVLGNLKDIE